MPNKYKYLSLADKLPKLRKILNADNIDEYYLSVLQRTDQIKKYSKFIDNYVCVSETALDSFCELFPNLKEKGKKIYNLLQSEIIQEKSKENIKDPSWSKENVNILTVCRIQEKS